MEQKDISLRNWGACVDNIFGTCQRIGERKECQVGNNDGAQKEGIGYGLMPIGHLNVFWASFDTRWSRFARRHFLFIKISFFR